jgi:formylmethanofuran dehydrogenase subunit E-like metal-binding protein
MHRVAEVRSLWRLMTRDGQDTTAGVATDPTFDAAGQIANSETSEAEIRPVFSELCGGETWL